MKRISLSAIMVLILSAVMVAKVDSALSSDFLYEKENKLYGSLVKPQARSDSLFQTTTSAVCGGTIHGPTHYLTTQNITNIFQWYIQTPSDSASCMLRFATVSDPADKDFKVIRPVDVNTFYEDGSFPCGREKGIESRIVKFGGLTSCDHCVIEWIWTTPQGKLRECADIMVAAGEDVKCLGMCQNGGICSKGVCICPPGYSGSYCQSSGVVSGTAGVLVTIFLVILGIILVAVAVFFFLLKKANEKAAERDRGTYGTSVSGQLANIRDEKPIVHQRFEDDDYHGRDRHGNPAGRLRQEEFKE
mmetsp:Transcript_37964/g.44258  ORF Transcript_37964/g.44258 Transcript_37964/m.44258 type:complete len:303 (+) Transcript_37964:25-933(+)